MAGGVCFWVSRQNLKESTIIASNLICGLVYSVEFDCSDRILVSSFFKEISFKK